MSQNAQGNSGRWFDHRSYDAALFEARTVRQLVERYLLGRTCTYSGLLMGRAPVWVAFGGALALFLEALTSTVPVEQWGTLIEVLVGLLWAVAAGSLGTGLFVAGYAWWQLPVTAKPFWIFVVVVSIRYCLRTWGGGWSVWEAQKTAGLILAAVVLMTVAEVGAELWLVRRRDAERLRALGALGNAAMLVAFGAAVFWAVLV